MFGFSLQKLLVLAAIIAAVWYGFKFVGRLQDQRRADAKLRASGAGQPKAAGRDSDGSAAPVVEEMVECPVCQAFVPARGTSRCERADCPY